MNTSVAIYSHAKRANVLEATVESLRDVGIEPDVITVQHAPPSQIQNRHNAHNALAKAYAGNAVLMLEDDVIPNEYLVRWIEWLERNVRNVTTLYACVGKFFAPDVRPFVEANRLPPDKYKGVHELQGLRGWYGAQAVWIPEAWASSILADRLFRIHEHEPYGPWDHAIRRHLIDRDASMNVVVPNIIQHRAPASVVNRTGPRHISPIFDVAAIPPETE